MSLVQVKEILGIGSLFVSTIVTKKFHYIKAFCIK